ncbi:preprotein translocase subunit YajC [Bacteroidales bacterium OttesenSCG-928-M06]|nr:preprotein translocase subunit YajC [Bacteroidales bacterium OttesenSCG-928-M06]
MMLSIFLQAPAAGGSSMMSILMIVALFAIMYFFMIRPQQKQRKEVEKQRAALKTGDKVVTAGGMYGKIKEINDTTFVIEIADGVKVKIDKTSVFAVADGNQAR